MELIEGELRIGYVDSHINAVLQGVPAGVERPFGRHFGQSEEFFIRLAEPFEVPHLPVHHDVRRAVPSGEYLARLASLVGRLVRLAPQLLHGLTYFFDPTENLRPCFFRMLASGDRSHAYLLRIDLAMHPGVGEVLEAGTNEITPSYRTRDLYLEPVLIPLAGDASTGSRTIALRVLQLLSDTWIGEEGMDGYHKRGVWIDRELTKFFSRLLLPPAARTYPFYPYLCWQRSLCEALLDLSGAGQQAAVPRLERAVAFLQPLMVRIEQEVRGAPFSEDLALFRELKASVPDAWYDPWRGVRVEAYLNDRDRKEYRVDA